LPRPFRIVAQVEQVQLVGEFVLCLVQHLGDGGLRVFVDRSCVRLDPFQTGREGPQGGRGDV
jgi:hypothetical protein